MKDTEKSIRLRSPILFYNRWDGMPFIIIILICIFVFSEGLSADEYHHAAHQEGVSTNWSGWTVKQDLQERSVEIAEDGTIITELREIWTCLRPNQMDYNDTKLIYSPIPDLSFFELVEISINGMDVLKNLKHDKNTSHAYVKDNSDSKITIVLTNLRPGDKVQVRLKLRQQPLIPEHFFSTIVLSKPYPLERSIYRVTLPNQRPLFYKMIGYEREPIITKHKEYRTYYWDVNNDLFQTQGSHPIIKGEDIPRIVVSSTQEWEVIRAWFAEMFLSARGWLPLRTEADFPAFKATEIDYSDFVGTLISISNNIRPAENNKHLGGLIPANTAEVWQRKEGDCKDIVNLLCFLLGKSNVRAWPVLVTPLNLDQELPNPYIFTHAFLKVVTPKWNLIFDPQKKSTISVETPLKNRLLELAEFPQLVIDQTGEIYEKN